jgi:hypothetical protein
MVKSRKMSWVDNVTHMREMKKACKAFVEKRGG